MRRSRAARDVGLAAGSLASGLFLLGAASASGSEARAECPDDPLVATRQAAATMEVSFVDLDDAGFAAARAALDEALPCVATPLEKRDVLAVHRAMALALFIDGDMRGSEKAWAAVKVLRPDWVLPEAMAPPEHLLRQIFERAQPDTEVVTLALAPANGWMVDGTWTDDVPARRTFVLQGLGEEGVIYTGYELSVAGVPLEDLVQPGPSRATRRARGVGTGVAALLAGGAVAATVIYVDAYNSLGDVPYEDIDATGARANTAGGFAIGLGAAAVGTFAVAWAVRW